MVNLDNKIKKGISWNMLTLLVNILNGFVVTAVLARLLSPNDFGIMGVINIIVIFSSFFIDFGLASAIIQNQNTHHKKLNTINIFNIFIGVILTVTIYTSSKYIAVYFNQSQLEPLLKFIAIIFTLQSFSIVHKALLQKRMEFKSLALVDLVVKIFKAVSSVVLAYNGYGVYSLVVAIVISFAIEMLIFNCFFNFLWKRKLYFSFKEIMNELKYGIYLLGFNILNFASQNIDKIIIGKFLGTNALGVYTIVISLIVIPQQYINPILTKVMFPALSSVQGDVKKMSFYYGKLLKVIAIIALPCLTGLALVSHEFILLVYGEKWISAVDILQIMCFVGIIRALLNPQGNIYLSSGKVNYMFYIDLVNGLVLTILAYLASKINLEAIAYAYLIWGIVTFPVVYKISFSIIRKPLKDLIKHLYSAAGASLIMFVVIHFLEKITIFLAIPVQLSINILVGLIVYTLSVLLLDKSLYNQLQNMYVKRKGVEV